MTLRVGDFEPEEMQAFVRAGSCRIEDAGLKSHIMELVVFLSAILTAMAFCTVWLLMLP